MPLSKIVIVYLLTLPIYFIIDMAWIGFVAKNFYKSQIGFLMRADLIWWAVIGFYVFFLAGLMYFAVLPALASGLWTKALISGALLGFCAYLAYDFTNYATIERWPLLVTFVDLLWGTVVSGAIATIGFFIGRAVS